jgi:rRNA-processing protein FCF1
MTVWWRDHGHPNLFTTADEPTVLTVAIDTNILMDLHTRKAAPQAERSQVLLAPDVADRIEKVVPHGLERDIEHEDGKLDTWWHLRETPAWRLRYQPVNPDTTVVDTALAELEADGQVARWTHGIYEPEALALGSSVPCGALNMPRFLTGPTALELLNGCLAVFTGVRFVSGE